MKTATGNFPLGWRRRNYAWEQDLDGMIAWALENDLEVVDLGQDADSDVKTVVEAGLRVGTADLALWQEMISPDAAKRRDALARNADYVRACAAAGANTFFIVMLPEDASRPRAENFGYMVESFGELAATFEACGAYLAIEGWPGPGSLVCTPETYRAFIDQVGSANMGVNYDPSHLVRMGIDPIRFLKEFVGHVFPYAWQGLHDPRGKPLSIRQFAGSGFRHALQVRRHELALYHPGSRRLRLEDHPQRPGGKRLQRLRQHRAGRSLL